MKLIILESPNKCSTISKIVGKDYIVLATAGHIMVIDPLYAYKTGIDVKNDFKIAYKFDPKKKDLLKKIKDVADKADEIYICSDGDREGEKIADEIRYLLKQYKNKIHRAIFNEITEKVVKHSIANSIPFDENLIHAAEARATIDRLTGYRMSPIALSKLGCESAGRVQSALLRLICEKETSIMNFKPSTYWEIFLDFKKGNKLLTTKLKEINGKKVDRITDQTVIDDVSKNCKSGNYKVADIKEKLKNVEPKLPFTTSTMQQAASSALNYSPKKSMATAQHLFEKGYITYLRTDATRLADDFVALAKAKIINDYGEDLYRGVVAKKKDANAQDAHEAIRPTDLSNTPEKLSQLLDSSELKLYRLIYNRTLASLFVPAKVKDTEVVIENGNYKFSLTGRTIVLESFLALYNDDTEVEKLPSFKVDEKIKDSELYSEQKQTQPPNRYSEAGLVKLMQDTGIGRPSSYAGTIETLKSRDYISVEKKSVAATEKGMKLNKMLVQYFPDFINVNYTSMMEADLDAIANGDKSKLDILKEFWKVFEPLVLTAAREANKDKPKPDPVLRKVCPKCSKQLLYRESKYGKFISCSGFPKCKYTESIESTEPTLQCPECGEGKLVKRVAKKTGQPFYGCSRWPNCNTIISVEKYKELIIPKESYSEGSSDKN